MSRLNIELSSDDLEKIIESYPTTSLEIKSFIIQEFAKRHLKPIVNDEIFKKVKSDLLKEVEENLIGLIGEKASAYTSERILNDVFKRQIKDIVEECISNQITFIVKDYIEEFMSNGDRIDELIDNRIKLHFINILNTGFNNKLKTISDKIDEILKEINK